MKKLILVGILAVFLTACTVNVGNYPDDYKFSDYETFLGLLSDVQDDEDYYSIDLVESMDVEDIEELDLSTISGDVKFMVGDDDQVTVRYFGIFNKSINDDAFKLDVHLGETFTFKADWKNRVGPSRERMIVTIPEDFVSDISINTISGDISIIPMKGDELSLKTVSGDIEVKEFQAVEVEIDTVSGDLDLTANSGLFDLKTISGDIRVQTEELKDTRIDTVSGDVKLTTKVLNADIDLETVSGDFYIDHQDK